MSYRIDISFKNCSQSEAYYKIEEFIRVLADNKEELFEKFGFRHKLDKSKDAWDNKDLIDRFIKELFTYHVWYSESIQALCFVGCFELCRNINKWFDGFIPFQNSTDQDYPYDTYRFNNKMDEASKLIENMDGNTFVSTYATEYENDLDYAKRSMIYEICYGFVEPIWERGFNVCFINGALDENLLEYREAFIKCMVSKSNDYKEMFKRSV